MMRALRRGTIGLGLLAALTGSSVEETRAAGYACAIPAAVLCPGCAAAVTVVLLPRGGCRVSFTPGAASSSVSGVVRLDVETPSQPVRRAAYVHARRPVQPAPASQGRCFVFNDRQYCE